MSTASLIELLRGPKTAIAVSLEQWNDIVVAGRKSQLLGQLAARLQGANMLSMVPAQVQRHLELDLLTATRRGESAMWEVASMRRAIDPALPLTFIKGCAYVLSGDHNAQGRTFSDIDLLVPRAKLNQAESILFSLGWKPNSVSIYDETYYRNWMHEVPPMEHVRRNTVLDLHHAINPPVSRYYIEPSKLIDNLIEVSEGIFVLSPADRVIHCALHLLQEGEPKKLLRDLFDLYLLVCQHFPENEDLNALGARAEILNVKRVSMTAVAASLEIFGQQAINVGERSRWLQAFVVRVAVTAHGSADTWRQWLGTLASAVVLAHSHWMKMPLKMLLPHLLRKSWLLLTPDKSNALSVPK